MKIDCILGLFDQINPFYSKFSKFGDPFMKFGGPQKFENRCYTVMSELNQNLEYPEVFFIFC